jgi:hypothetical protein
VQVHFTQQLRARTKAAIAQALKVAALALVRRNGDDLAERSISHGSRRAIRKILAKNGEHVGKKNSVEKGASQGFSTVVGEKEESIR